MRLEAKGVSRRFFRLSGQGNTFEAVSPTDLTLDPGTLTALVGRSGSGKTTLLNLLAGLLKPTSGTVSLDGQDLYAMDDAALSRFRNARFGVVPQGHAALNSLTVAENVALPAGLYARRAEAMDEAVRLLDRFGIRALKNARPSELSGGELRRMSIARALINHPDVVFADEPTGDLDDENTALVLRTLREIADGGTAVLLVTHETDALRYADSAYRMDAGVLSRIDSDCPNGRGVV